MTKTYTIKEFMELTTKKETAKRDLVLFIIINLLLVGAYDLLTVAIKVVEAVEWH